MIKWYFITVGAIVVVANLWVLVCAFMIARRRAKCDWEK